MADVSDLCDAVGDLVGSGDDGRRDRAQLVIVGGLVLAFSLIALTFILNSSLYTENIESRSTLPVADDAKEYHATLKAEFGTIVERTNDEDYDNYGNVETATLDRVAEVERLASDQYLEERGAFVGRTGGTTTVAGALVKQTTVREFTNVGGVRNWTLVSGTDRLRAMRLTVDEGDVNEDGVGDGFTVLVTESGVGTDTWTAEITESSNRVVLTVERDDGTTFTCTSTTERTRLDLTAGRLSSLDASGDVVDVTDCGYRFAPAVDGPYTVQFVNGDEADGTFTTTVEDGGLLGVVNCVGVDCGGAGGSQPYEVRGVYALETTLAYETTEIDYETTLRVAPGEPETVV